MVRWTGEGRSCIPVRLTRTWDGLINWTKSIWKVEERPWAASNLQPSNLCSNAYRLTAIQFTLKCLQESARWSGNFFFLFSCICINRTLESDLLSLSTPSGTKQIFLLLNVVHYSSLIQCFFRSTMVSI